MRFEPRSIPPNGRSNSWRGRVRPRSSITFTKRCPRASFSSAPRPSTMPPSSASPILDGLRVVELSAFIAAPLGGATLAALGADVIRVDPPGGGIDIGRWPLGPDGRSLYWQGLNRGKRSLALDLRSAAGRELVRRLATLPGEP